MSSRYLIDGRYADPDERRFCTIFEALAGGLLFGGLEAGAGAGAAALGAEAAGGFGAGLFGGTLGAAAPLAVGGELALPLSIGGATAAGLEGGSELAPLFSLGGEFAGSGGGVPGATLGGIEAPAAALPGANTMIATGPPSALSPASTTGAAPIAGAPAAPASIGGASPSATGAGLGGDIGAAGFSGGGPTQAATGTGAQVTGADFGGGGTTGGSTVVGKATGGLDKALTGVTGGALNLKDVGTLASLGGLGMNILNQGSPLPGQKQIGTAANRIEGAAGNLAATGQGIVTKGEHLQDFMNRGTLPPGLAQGLKTATESAKAQIKQGYAARGMSGSSAEAQDVQAAEERAAAAGAQVALQLLQQGSNMVATGVSTQGQAINAETQAAQLYDQIMRTALAEDEALQRSIGNFAGALAGSGGGNQITVKAA